MFELTEVAPEEARILDFDMESVAAGFADPAWVPQKITCIAWSWIGEDEIHHSECGPEGVIGPKAKKRRAKMLKPFLEEIVKATMVTGHNILRHDLPLLNTECMRLGLPKLSAVRAQDTIRVVKTKGFKKGQDNLARLLHAPTEKYAMDWQQWDDAYDEPGWPTVIHRATSDVLMHKQMRATMIERGWLKPPVTWNP